MRDVIIACDFSSKEETLNFLNKFNNKNLFLKIGMELFYSTGIDFVKELKKEGYKIFLDLKLHDIPNTVYKTIKMLSNIGVDIINVHAAGGIEMMQAAKKAIEENKSKTQLIAVTQLTSITEEVMQNELLIKNTLIETVIKYAQNTKKANLDGIVCSPLEVKYVKEVCGSDFICVTPGIRFLQSSKDDQKRVTTPQQAKELGSTYIVVGRVITSSDNPEEVYNICVEEFK
ncbi:MAG: orotidine-5'-phosphate decarboxylase [Erysipelotrichaceae bacterium]|nr:orotidine-5'-phosphate decarboxylase [Erysipelotrichaceae bacterium]